MLQAAKTAKAHAKAMADERRALLAEEHSHMERLLAAISASINRDLPQRLDTLLRAQLAALPPPLAASALQPAVQAALATALPAELSGSALQVPGPSWPAAAAAAPSFKDKNALRHAAAFCSNGLAFARAVTQEHAAPCCAMSGEPRMLTAQPFQIRTPGS